MGPDKVRLAVVGEAPGFQESKQGKVFVGPSGKLLNTVLEYHSLDRTEVYVDNVVACRPPDNRTPTKEEIKCCLPRLKHELGSRVSEDGAVLALGNTANQSLTGSRTGITTARVGPPVPGKPTIVPTFHPAACLRSADSFPHLVADTGKAADIAKGIVRPTFGEPSYKVFDEPYLALKAIEELGSKYKRYVVDIEAGFEKDTEYDHPDMYQMLCIGIAYSPGKAIVIGEEALKDTNVQAALKWLLEWPGKEWVAHNGKFDLAGLRRYGHATLFFDTMLASYVLDERSGTNGLKYLATEYLGAPHYDEEIKKYVHKGESYGLIPRDILYRYNAYDVACTWALMERYEVELEEQGLRHVHDFLCKASGTLMDMEMEGVAVDLPYLDHLSEHYLDGLADLEKELLDHGLLNPRSPKQVKETLAEIGITIPKKKNQKGVMAESTDEETLRLLLETAKPGSEANRFLDLMLTHRREQKLYGTYVKGTRKRLRKGRVHPTFLLHGTTSGRLACRNPNLQNVPRESSIRRLFVPARGNIFVQADYATIELRVLATLAQDEYLKSIFDQGRDIHSEFSVRFYGPNFTKDQRIRTKAFIFGLAYGREARSIAMEYKIPEWEAQQQMDEFFAAIPGVVAFREEIKRKILEEQSDLVTPFGRHRRFWLITKDNQKDVVKEGLSFLPQSTASDINLQAAIKLGGLFSGTSTRLRLLVHDSIMVECPEKEKESIGSVMRNVMMETAIKEFSDYVPFPVDLECGYSWGDLEKM